MEALKMRQGYEGLTEVKAWLRDRRVETDEELGLDCQGRRERWGKEMLWRQWGSGWGVTMAHFCGTLPTYRPACFTSLTYANLFTHHTNQSLNELQFVEKVAKQKEERGLA